MKLTLQQALEKGIEAYKAGKVEEAGNLYKAILKAHPKHPDANHSMGVLAVGVGNVKEGLPFFKAALETNPSKSQFWLSYISALIKLDQIVEAKAVLSQAIDRGIKGETFDQLVQQVSERNVDLQNPPPEQLQLIIKLYTQGQLQKALSQSNQMLERFPNSVVLYNIAGASNSGLNQFEAAIESFRQALRIKPDSAEAYNNMGISLNDKGDSESAIESFRQALQIKSGYADAYYNMGIALNNMGDLKAAEDSYRQAIRFKPDHAVAYRHLSILHRYIEHDENFVTMQNLCLDPSITDQQRCHLNFALSKASEDLNEIGQSFSFLKLGNELLKKMSDYDISQDITLFSQLKKSYPGIARGALQSASKPSDLRPIFIVGMPRSGTTLVEQIVSSHSEVTGAGELHDVDWLGKSIVAGIVKPSTEMILNFRQRYIEALRKRADGQSIVTDKMPWNFRYIGLIFSAFPDAKIIHVTRDPAATCWSNYKHYFQAKGLGYSYDLEDTVTCFVLYQDLMQFWQGHYGDRIYNLNYDNLTINQVLETRSLIQYLGLKWEDDCLSPQSNKRSVRTASQQQVQQKVYQGSSRQWRKFEPYLDGVFDQFESVAEDQP